MKKILTILFVLLISNSVQAVITSDQITDPAVVKNTGYSQQMADIICVQKARAAGEEYYTADEQAFKKENWFVKFWRKFYVYTDPAAEDYWLLHHDNHTTPSTLDL